MIDAGVVLENLALRQQLAILRHKAPRPRLRRADRAFWVSLARVWDRWRSALILVKPEGWAIPAIRRPRRPEKAGSSICPERPQASDQCAPWP